MLARGPKKARAERGRGCGGNAFRRVSRLGILGKDWSQSFRFVVEYR